MASDAHTHTHTHTYTQIHTRTQHTDTYRHTHRHTYTHNLCLCVCVCVCDRESDRERENVCTPHITAALLILPILLTVKLFIPGPAEYLRCTPLHTDYQRRIGGLHTLLHINDFTTRISDAVQHSFMMIERGYIYIYVCVYIHMHWCVCVYIYTCADFSIGCLCFYTI